MENKGSLLNLSSVDIPDTKLSIRIPTVGEILEDEQNYYSLVSSITSTPFQYMVQLDDMGIDFTTITDYQLFTILFPSFAKNGIGILFGDIDLSDIRVQENAENGTLVLYSPKNGIEINELIYTNIVNYIRKINNLKREARKPGNDEAKKFRIKLERKKQKRNAGKPYDPYLEKMVVALVNRPEFKYNYEQANSLTIYQFNKSLEQVQRSITFGNTMAGIYAGAIDSSKIKDSSCLSWIPMK